MLLANCHLMMSWLNELEKIIEALKERNPKPGFRLWLSSSPHPKFPIGKRTCSREVLRRISLPLMQGSSSWPSAATPAREVLGTCL